MKRKTDIIKLICIGLLFCTCSNLTNPFLNAGDTKVKIASWNLSDSVTINIFSTYTISVRALLGENLDSFKVLIDKNRLWSSIDTVISANKIRPQSYFSFPFSFYDTGWQKIQLISYKKNGDSTIDTTVNLHAVSPLKQSTVSGSIGDSIQLSTLPVNDQVLYVWNLHNGVIVKENHPSVKMKVTTDLTSRYGELYLEDFSGHRSPVVLFEILSNSQAELSIACINDSIKGDTVYSTDTKLKFMLEVSGAQQLKSAWINGNSFDQNQRRGDGFLLGHNIGGLDTITAPRKLDITIIDDQGRSLKKTFFVKFIKIKPVIQVIFPDDSMQTAASSVNVLGKVSNIRQNSTLYIFASNNGKVLKKAAVTFTDPAFAFEIPLPGSSNHISLELFADSLMNGSILAATDFYVIYNPEHHDTLAPQIRNIRCNGKLVDSLFTSRTDTLNLEIDAVDNSDTLTVKVNGNNVSKKAGELFYTADVVLTHKKERTAIIIEAVDSAGYSASDTIYVIYNRLPQWVKIPSHSVINAGENHQFQLSVIDPDNDPILATMRVDFKSGSVMLNASSGLVTLNPQMIDTGSYDVVLEASDEYEPVDTFFTLFVKGNGAAPVQLMTSDDDFPDTVFIGETLSVSLQPIPLTGTPPFRYGAYFIDSKPSVILDGTDNLLSWVPKTENTGLRKLRIEIKDSLGYSDCDTVEIPVLLTTVRWVDNFIQFYEDGSVLNVPTIKSSRPVPYPVKIEYQISFPYNPGASESDITATPLSGIIQLKTGDTIANFLLRAFNDTIPENTEKFKIELVESDSIKSESKTLECEIIDNDKVYFEFDRTEMQNTEKNRTDTVIVEINKKLEKRLELTCLLDASSTAKPVEDFTLSFAKEMNKVVFEPGETKAFFLINIINDESPEPNEKIILKLRSDNEFASPKKSYTVKDVFTYTIRNDDIPVSYSFSVDEKDSSVFEKDAQIILKVSLNMVSGSDVVVKYYLDTEKTNAVANTDYRFPDNTGILTFRPGDISEEIKIDIIDDTIPEDDAQLTLNLHSESNLTTPGSDTSFTLNIKSNEVRAYFPADNGGGDEKYNNRPYCQIMLTSAPSKPVDVYFRVVKTGLNQADSGKDYTISAPGIVSFSAGNTAQDLGLFIRSDFSNDEPTEYINLEITGVSDRKSVYVKGSTTMKISITNQ
ncbi:MAG TPA: Calx-beta domain-containing protein [Chitinispirillaceae bacterium]|nr:Calx-beta domain-containing protein [Chitinispirillaceae bacterium]